MSKQQHVSRPIYGLLPTDVEGFDSLAELALDLRWSWNHCTDDAWRKLDPAIWELTENPWAVLQTVSRDKLQNILADPAFRKKIDELVQSRRRAVEEPAVFHPCQSPVENSLADRGAPRQLPALPDRLRL